MAFLNSLCLLVFSVSHSLNVHVVDVLIHARDTLVAFNSQFDEATVAPVCAPRVLHEPVVLRLDLHVSAASPVWLVTLLVWRQILVRFALTTLACISFTFLRLSALLLCLVWVSFALVQANDDDTVVEFGRALVFGAEDAGLVVAPAFAAGSDSYRHWSIL